MPEPDGDRVAELAGHNFEALHRQLPYFIQSSPLIGRASELAEVTGLLADPAVRLVTIAGRSGVGKTRLALEAARSLDARHPGTSFFVSLASVSDPDLMFAAIADQLEISAGPGAPLADVVVRWLRRGARVLLLDNFEHLLAAAGQVSGVLDACHGLRFLVTSQAPLRLADERVVSLGPLPLPELLNAGLDEVAAQAAVALYCDRARAASHRFRLDYANSAAVVSLCRELEGLPLAIELAAARATTLPAADLANRLARRRLDMLRSSRSDAPPRHHDMRAAIGWTYNLLTAFQRRLLRRLSVAAGTFDIDDAEAMGDGLLAEVLDGLNALVDFHLVTPAPADGRARFELAPSIRDFAAEELASSGEAADIETRWIDWLAGRAREAATALTAQAPDSWWIWLEAAHDCLRNALQNCLTSRRAEAAIDLASALAPYWDARAAHPAHSRLLDQAIELAAEADIQSVAVAEALLWSGLMGIRVLITETADRYVEHLKRGEELARKLADERLLLLAAQCRVLTTLMTGDVAGGVQATAEGLDIATRRGELCWISRFELHSARWALSAGDFERAVNLSLAALEDGRRATDSRAILNAAFLLQVLAPGSPAAAAALPPPEDLLSMARAAHQKLSEAVLLPVLAVQSLAAGDLQAAARWCGAALDISGSDPTSYPAGYALFAAVEVAGRHGDHERAARLHGRLQETRPRLHAAMSPSFVTANLAAVEEVRAALGADAFDAAIAAGTGWSWEACVAEMSDYLRTLAQQIETAPDRAEAGYPMLTDRQLQVVRLLVQGLTNKEIASQLRMTPKTVMHHTVAIYQRLGVRGRSEAVAWAIRADVAPAAS
jgi:predicted ATPase/DNA-binding CsgD family transcriptional regulator